MINTNLLRGVLKKAAVLKTDKTNKVTVRETSQAFFQHF